MEKAASSWAASASCMAAVDAPSGLRLRSAQIQNVELLKWTAGVVGLDMSRWPLRVVPRLRGYKRGTTEMLRVVLGDSLPPSSS